MIGRTETEVMRVPSLAVRLLFRVAGNVLCFRHAVAARRRGALNRVDDNCFVPLYANAHTLDFTLIATFVRTLFDLERAI